METQSKDPESVYDFTVEDAGGNDVALNTYKGKVLLIVNVASKCGMTNSNYTELNQLYVKYKDQEFGMQLVTDVEPPKVMEVERDRTSPEEVRIQWNDGQLKSLEILAFPCNQFGEEEPGSNDQITQFVCTRFKSEFPIFGKIEVNGDNAAPLYKFLKSGKWGIFGDDVQWNFAKFLVDSNGQPVDRYYPTTSPLTIERDIKKLLGIS